VVPSAAEVVQANVDDHSTVGRPNGQRNEPQRASVRHTDIACWHPFDAEDGVTAADKWTGVVVEKLLK